MEIKFVPYSGYLMGLPTTENHLVFRYIGEGKILFSVTRQGDAASCHFASDKKGLKSVKTACDEFVKFCFWLFPWCKMCLAHIKPGGIARMIERIEFALIGGTTKGLVYARLRP